MRSAVIVHATDADEAQLHHLFSVMQEAEKVEYWPTDIPWWDLEIGGNESSEEMDKQSNEEDKSIEKEDDDHESGEEDD